MKIMPARQLRNQKLSSRGQTAVFVFILLLVGLTIGLSLSTRTVRDLQSSVGSDLSSRAFAAAEAGVEEALRQDLNSISDGVARTGTFVTDNNSQFSYTVVKSTTFSQVISRDNTVQMKLRRDDGTLFTGFLQFFWTRTTDTVENAVGARPSLELTFIKNVAGSYSIVKYALNAEIRANNFHNPDGTSQSGMSNSLPNYVTGQPGDTNYTNLATINIAASDNYEAVRITPLYNKSSVRVSGTNLPSNTFQITSTGTTANAVARVVQVTRTIPSLPSIFDYVLFNGSTLPLSK